MMRKNYYVSADTKYFYAEKGILAFAPPIPSWIWINEDSKRALEAIKSGSSAEDFAHEIAEEENIPYEEAERALKRFLDNCPVVTTSPIVEKSYRSSEFKQLGSVWLCPSGCCNMSCVYCAVDPVNKPPEQKPLEFWIEVVKESLELGATNFTLAGGEPSIYQHFTELIEWIDRNTKASVGILTNGVAISDEMAERISKTRASIQISIDGARPKTHDAIRGKGTFDKILKVFNKFRSFGKQPQISMTVCKLNISDVDLMPNFARTLGCNSIRIAPFFDMGRGSSISKSDLNETEKIDLTLKIIRLRRTTMLDVSCAMTIFEDIKMRMRQDHCSAGHGIIAIDYDGGVFPCADGFQMPDLCAGYIGKEPLRAIMTSELMSKVRTLTHYNIASCKQCFARHMCGGGCMMQRFYAEHKGFSFSRICNFQKKILEKTIKEEV
jgi:radical SAM protein with 4Fe4S-binding SPASM domain